MKKVILIMIMLFLVSSCAIYPTYRAPSAPLANLHFQPLEGAYNSLVVIYKNSEECRGPQKLPKNLWENNEPVSIAANQDVALEISWDKGLAKICDMMVSFSPRAGKDYTVQWGTNKHTCFIKMYENINHDTKPVAFDRRLRAAMIFSNIQTYCRPINANKTYELDE